MRFYDIQVLDSSGKLTKHWTSHPKGNQQPPDPGALRVEIDAYQGPQQSGSAGGSALPGSFVRVWGISLTDIGQAANLNGHDLVLRGGMGKGLPLANPAQAGILIQGHIQQAFANWIGTSMTLDMLLVAGSIAAGTGAAQNFAVNWPQGQSLATTLNSLLKTLFPKATIDVAISSALKNAYDELHFAGTWTQLGDYLVQQSRRIMNTGPALVGQWNTPNNALSKYPGVQVNVDGNTISVFDGTVSKSPKKIALTDIIGQPTWIGPQTLQVTLVMRGDLKVGDFITLPPTRASVTAASLSPYSQTRQDLLFNGSFWVQMIHHQGNYKDPGPLAWVTVINAVVQTQTDGQGQVSLDDGTTPAKNPPAGGPGVTPTSAPTNFEVTGEEAGYGPPSAAPSVGNNIEEIPSPAPGTTGSTNTTSTDIGLTQTAPAASLGESIVPGQPFNPGP